MALQLLNLAKSLENLAINCTKIAIRRTLEPPNVLLGNTAKRCSHTSFFNRLPAESLWKGVTSVSNAGRKRGRGKTVSRRNIKDLNRGQVIGVGKANIVWPGLNAPIIRGKELVQRQQLPEDPERMQKLIKLRSQMGNVRRPKLNPLERGWSGTKMPGRSLGPPEPVSTETFEGFDTKVLEFKQVSNMKGKIGRKRQYSAFVITGNGKGLAGFARGKTSDGRAALKLAKNRAGQKLMQIKIFRGHTVYHDFFTQFGDSKIYVAQRPEGHGLVCHRAIRTICQVVGIKDLYAKVEATMNIQTMTKAFLLGLLRQKTHQEMAEDKRLHLVEFTKENGYYPTVLASPSDCRKGHEVKDDEVLDFSQYCLDGRVRLQKKTVPPFYTRTRAWEVFLKKNLPRRNQHKVRTYMRAEYGELRSFLADKYPEARAHKRPPKNAEGAEEETAA